MQCTENRANEERDRTVLVSFLSPNYCLAARNVFAAVIYALPMEKLVARASASGPACFCTWHLVT